MILINLFCAKLWRFFPNFDFLQHFNKTSYQEILNYKNIGVPFIFHMAPWWPMYLFWGLSNSSFRAGQFLRIFGGGWAETKTGFCSSWIWLEKLSWGVRFSIGRCGCWIERCSQGQKKAKIHNFFWRIPTLDKLKNKQPIENRTPLYFCQTL